MRAASRLVLFVVALVVVAPSVWADSDPVPLPCEPNCTVDPCKLAPERCKKKGGPIGHSQSDAASKKQDVNATKVKDDEDDCKWCTPCSKTPGSSCLKCCTPGAAKK